MAKSNWRQQRERQRREELRAQREYERLVAQQQREAERAEAQADRERRTQHAAERQAEAAERTAEAERRVDELATVLRTGLRRGRVLDFQAQRATYRPSEFIPGDLGTPKPEPQWERFAPQEPGVFGRLFGSENRRVQEMQDARMRFEQELAAHRQREQHRHVELEKARQQHQQREAERKRHADDHNAQIDALQRAFDAGEP